MIVQIFGDLALIIGGFVNRNPNFATWAGHRSGTQSRELALNVEVTDFSEIEMRFVEGRPLCHIAIFNVVRQVIDISEANAYRLRINAWNRAKIDIVDRVIAIAVDEVDQRTANTFDGWNAKLHRTGTGLDGLGAIGDEMGHGVSDIMDAKRNGIGAGAMNAPETLSLTIGLGIENKVDAALTVEGHVFAAVSGDRSKAELFEQLG